MDESNGDYMAENTATWRCWVGQSGAAGMGVLQLPLYDTNSTEPYTARSRTTRHDIMRRSATPYTVLVDDW